MASEETSSDHSKRLVYFAAERTLTSWIRTALSLMALGFVVDRFDLILRQTLLTSNQIPPPPAEPLWRWTGLSMIGLGVLMAVVSGGYYLRFAQRYRRDGSTDVGRSLVVGAVFTFVLAGFGVVVLSVLALTLP